MLNLKGINLPAVDTANGEVCFVCPKYPSFKILYSKEQNVYKETENGERILVDVIPPKYIEFKNNVYVTNDANELSFLRNCPSLTGADNNPQCVSEVSVSDMSKLVAQKKYESLAQKLGPEAMAEWLSNVDAQVGTTADPVSATVESQPETDQAPAVILEPV